MVQGGTVNEGQTTCTYWSGEIIKTAALTAGNNVVFINFGIVNVKMLSFECFWLIQATPVSAVFWLLSGCKKGKS